MLSERLNLLIQTLDIKKSIFAQKINFSKAYISHILNGTKKNPSDRFYQSIYEQFNVNIEWLKNGKGEIFKVDSQKFSNSEKDLITKYNSLPITEKEMINEIVSVLFFKHLQKSNVSLSI